MLVNAARAVGPAVAGTLIATVGVGICFLINAGTFVAVLFALMTLNVSELRPSPPAVRAKGQLREGFVYVRHTSSLLVPLGMMALVGMLAYEFQVVLPIVASRQLRRRCAGLRLPDRCDGRRCGGRRARSRRTSDSPAPWR